jgi:hypothetical protein
VNDEITKRALALSSKSSVTSLRDMMHKISPAKSILSELMSPSISERMKDFGSHNSVFKQAQLMNPVVNQQFHGVSSLLESLNSANSIVAAMKTHELFSVNKTIAESLSESFLKQFRSVSFFEVPSFTGQVAQQIQKQYFLPGESLAKMVQDINKPWLNIESQFQSISGICRLQGIGHLLSNFRPFDQVVANALRPDLGDWREKIDWQKFSVIDTDARLTLYREHGVNFELTSFPQVTFEESLTSSGLTSGAPSLVTLYGEPVEYEPNSDFEAFARNNVVHDWLQRFESSIRKFIDEAMRSKFGNEWPRTRLPNGIFDKWTEKQSRDLRKSSLPLICYADFQDYELVICKKDNWKEVFAIYFDRIESVRESLNRLYGPRIAVMHARMLIADDQLLVFAEVRRLSKAFSILWKS